MRRIAVVVTSRASYARIRTVLAAIRDREDLELVIIGAASLLLFRFGDAVDVMRRDGFEIADRVYMLVEGENPTTMAKSVGLGIIELAAIFDRCRPDIVLSVADRFETIATAISASYLNIPVAHVQGGEITGSIDEKVRHAVTKLSSLHFVANERAAQRVRMMGEADDTIFVTGCPSIDIARSVLADSSWMTTSYLYDRYAGTGARVDIENRFIVVAQHPVTTEFEDAYEQMWTTLLAVEKTGMPSLVFWPNADAGSEATAKAIRVFREQHNPDNMCFFRNLSPEDFLALLLRCACIVGNSSAGIRECAYLGVPAVNIGSRQEGRERGPNVLDVGYNIDEIVSAVQHQAARRYPQSTIYGAGDAGMRIAEILAATSPRIEKKFVDRSMP